MDLLSIYPYTIGLPNGAKTVALHEGAVRLSPKLNIHNVLFIPELKCNSITLSD